MYQMSVEEEIICSSVAEFRGDEHLPSFTIILRTVFAAGF